MISKATPRLRQAQRQGTRRQLLEAGLRVVAAKGFAGATTAAIAEATGKAHGTVFVHFRTRDALVTELVAEIGRGLAEKMAGLEAQNPTLAQVLDAHLAAIAPKEALYARLLCEASTLPPAAREQVLALQSAVAARLRAAYLRARAQGTVRVLDPFTAGNLWISLSSHYLMNRDFFAPGGSVVAKSGTMLKAQLLDLLKP